MSDLRTPDSVAGLEDAIRSDLAAVTAAFVEGARLLEGLEDALRVLPSSQSRIKAWRNQLDHILGQIGEEQADVTRKLLGAEPPPIESAVDEDRLAAVRKAREHEEGCPLRHYSYEVGSGEAGPECECSRRAA